MILPVVLYGCETWSLTMREEHRLRVFENGVLRGIFGTKRDVITGEWRKLHNEALNGVLRRIFGAQSDVITGEWRKLHDEELSGVLKRIFGSKRDLITGE